MTQRTRNVLGAVAALLLAACGFATAYVARAVPVGTAYFAKVLCSAVFVSGRPAEDVLAVDLAIDNPIVDFLEVDVDGERRQVSASFRGYFENTAVHRDGLGCTLAIGVTPDELRSRTLDGPRPAPRPWPGDEEDQEDQETEGDEDGAGIDMQRLRRAVDGAFEEPDPDRPRRTRAVVVVHDGELVAESYAPGFDAGTALAGWSMTKSVTNALVGILVAQGRLDVHTPAPVPEWQGADDPRGAVTLDQLLRMSSGLDFDETYGDPGADVQQMLFRRPSAAAFAAAMPLRAAPDGEWSYSSGTSNIVSRIVRQTVEAAGEDYWSFPRRALFGPLGMTSATFEPDASGTFVGSSFCFATARDWARFGLLYLRDGVWDGERILPPGWVGYSTTPTPLSNGRYGAHLWLNAEPSGSGSERRWPSLPADLFMMSGYEGQWVYVVPSKQAVVVRLGMTQDRDAWDGPAFLTEVLAALP
jgi:CubicO group peptidase (beta-lactamase class C family)